MPRRSSRPDPLVKAGRYALTLDFLFRSPGAAKGAGQRLMTSLTADWRRHNAIVIGYPPPKASSASTSSWAHAATIPQAKATETPYGHRHRTTNGTAKSSLTIPTSRRVHTGALSASVRVKARSRMARGSCLAASNRRALRYM